MIINDPTEKLICFIQQGCLDKVKELLLDHELDVNDRDSYSMTPLMWAALHSELEIAKVLYEHGAILDCFDMGGCTALHYAMRQEDGEVFTFWLLENGANYSRLNKDGETALECAKYKCKKQDIASHKEFLKRVELWIEHQPDDESRITAYMCAAAELDELPADVNGGKS